MKLLMKKAQAAMEFLMTYGWALLIILIAIGALAYFGVLNPSKLLPESCVFPAGVSCVEFTVTGGTVDPNIQIIATNNMGADLSNVIFSVTGDVSNTAVCGTNVTQTLPAMPLASWIDGATQTFTFNCGTNPTTGAKFKSDVIIGYSKGGIRHNKQGRLVASVE